MCAEYCPLECESTTYSTVINSYPNTNDNTTVVSIYYGSLKYTSYSEQPKMQMFDLISNIGGTMSLFISISFVSLFEIIEILIEMLFIALNRRDAKIRINPRDETTRSNVLVNQIDIKSGSLHSLQTRLNNCEHQIAENLKIINNLVKNQYQNYLLQNVNHLDTARQF